MREGELGEFKCMLYTNAKLSLMFVPVPVAAKYFIPVILLLDLFSGVTGFSLFGGNIAHYAHLGGALTDSCSCFCGGNGVRRQNGRIRPTSNLYEPPHLRG